MGKLWTPDDEPGIIGLRRVALIIGADARVRDVPVVGELLGIGNEPTEREMFAAVADLLAGGKKVVIIANGRERIAEIQPMT